MKNEKALLIIDVQQAMFDVANPVFQGNLLLDKSRELIFKAKSLDIPIIYIQHNEKEGDLEQGKIGWEIHSLIKPEEHDIVVQKNTPDSFYNTTLQEELQVKGIKELIITGIQSEVCVDTTCRSAFSKGYKVTLLSDVHSTWDTESLSAKQIIMHHNNVLKWFAEVKSSEDAF